MQQKHWKIEFSQQNKKADKELTRERIALRKFQRSIQSVQKCKTAEVEAESLLAEQLSLYIGTRGKFSEFSGCHRRFWITAWQRNNCFESLDSFIVSISKNDPRNTSYEALSRTEQLRKKFLIHWSESKNQEPSFLICWFLALNHTKLFRFVDSKHKPRTSCFLDSLSISGSKAM